MTSRCVWGEAASHDVKVCVWGGRLWKAGEVKDVVKGVYVCVWGGYVKVVG